MIDSVTGERIVVRSSFEHNAPYLVIDPEQEEQLCCLLDDVNIVYARRSGAIVLGVEPAATVIELPPEVAEDVQRLLDAVR